MTDRELADQLNARASKNEDEIDAIVAYLMRGGVDEVEKKTLSRQTLVLNERANAYRSAARSLVAPMMRITLPELETG